MGDRVNTKFIDGIHLIPKKQIKDSRGMVMHMMRCNSEEFRSFGEVYFSYINPGIIKGWKLHEKISQNIVIPFGSVLFTLYDPRKSSPTFNVFQEISLSLDDYKLMHIPNGIWYAFKNLSQAPSLIANCTDLPHDPTEVRLLPLNTDQIPNNPYINESID